MDIKLYFTEKGCGDVMVLLHGNNGSGDYFENQMQYFSKKYRVIAVDTRGHGKSPRGKTEFTLDRFADDLKDFFEEMIIDRAIIVGFSDGANIALIFAMKYPQFVSKLVLNGANLYPGGIKPKYHGEIVFKYLASCVKTMFNTRNINEKEMLGLMATQPHIKPSELSCINLPTLVIAGTDDMINDDHTVMIKNNIHNSTLRILEGTHFIAAENPTEFNRAVEEFLDEN